MGRRFPVIRGGGKPSEPGIKLPPFEQTLLVHLDGLFAFALRLERGQRERAEDLVQETSLQAFRNYEALHSIEGMKAPAEVNHLNITRVIDGAASFDWANAQSKAVNR